MEVENHKVKKSFIGKKEASELVEWIEGIDYRKADANHHLAELSKELNGASHIFDVSKTELTRYVTEYQKITNSSEENIPAAIYDLIERIAREIDIPTDHVFFQAVDMQKGGKINPHYDASVEGYVNYKCNLCLLSESYDFFVDGTTFHIEQGDLYCFEASLYKHWTNVFDSRRVFISFGFMVPYERLGRTEKDPRVRLSRRIEKYFQRVQDK
jgi:hypothetical protein